MNFGQQTPIGTLAINDFFKGLLIALVAGAVQALVDLDPKTLTLDWTSIIIATRAAGIAYLAKQFITGQGGQLLTNAPAGGFSKHVEIPASKTP